MTPWPLLVLLLLATSANLAPRTEELRDKATRSGGVVDVDEEDFRRLVWKAPRPYGVLVLFTAADSKYQCEYCG